MDQLVLLLAPVAPYVALAVGVATLAELTLDHVVLPYVKSTPDTTDDSFVAKYVEPPVRLTSKIVSFLSLRLGRK